MSLLVISPHLDDAVLSCGLLLASRPGSTVLTIFAGAPRGGERLTPWDARCGFRSSAEAIAERRREDDAALTLLRCRPVRLDFCDSQYQEPPAERTLSDAIQASIAGLAPSQVFYPMGLFHSDHRLAHEATRTALDELAVVDALLYEDAPYRALRGVLQKRLYALAQIGLVATPIRLATNDEEAARLKRQALGAYRSQLHGFGPGGYEDAHQPERYWRLDAGNPTP